MATLRETLKELYDEFVEENRTPTVNRLASLSVSQTEAAQLYAAAVARASGVTQPPAAKPMTSRLVVIPDSLPATPVTSPSASPSDAPIYANVAMETSRPDILNVLSNLTPDQVVQGIVLSEILGKPVSRRLGSNRIGR